MSFYDFHPLTLIIYFASVITFTMLTLNPVLLLLSFLGAFIAVFVISRKTDWVMYSIVFIMICITNPLFSHNGETVLFYLFDQRITLEALFYGFGAGLLILSVIYWFKLFSFVFTQDKLTWLIGRISPKLCVVFCMALRFIPMFKENAKTIYNAQLSLNVFDTSKLKGKILLISNVFSALVSMSIENAIETADTMRARGFDGKKRSSYSQKVFSRKNMYIIISIVILDLLICVSMFLGEGAFYYYPSIKFAEFSHLTPAFYVLYAALNFIPVIIELAEAIRWKYLISKI